MILIFTIVIVLQTSSLLFVTYFANKLNILGLDWVAITAFGLIAVGAFCLNKIRIGSGKAIGSTAVCSVLSLLSFFLIGYFVFDWKGLL